MNNFLKKQQEEYSKLTCPICGCKPKITPNGSESCAHEELERLMDEVDNRLLKEERESEPHRIKPFAKKG